MTRTTKTIVHGLFQRTQELERMLAARGWFKPTAVLRLGSFMGNPISLMLEARPTPEATVGHPQSKLINFNGRDTDEIFDLFQRAETWIEQLGQNPTDPKAELIQKVTEANKLAAELGFCVTITTQAALATPQHAAE